jgi:hypothetical protein
MMALFAIAIVAFLAPLVIEDVRMHRELDDAEAKLVTMRAKVAEQKKILDEQSEAVRVEQDRVQAELDRTNAENALFERSLEEAHLRKLAWDLERGMREWEKTRDGGR